MPRDGKETPLPPNFVQRAVEGIRYIISGVTPSTWFGPDEPLAPMAPAEVAGRQFDYPVGYNLVTTPRPEEGVSFAQLRSLAGNQPGFKDYPDEFEIHPCQLDATSWQEGFITVAEAMRSKEN